MIDIHFSLTSDEYLEAQKLFLRSDRKSHNFARFLRLLTIPVLLSSAFTLYRAPRDSFGFVLLAVGIMGLLLPFTQKRGFRKRFEKEKLHLTNVHFVFDDEGIHVDIPELGTGLARWASVTDWLEGDSVFLLRSGLLMRVVPKSALTPVQKDELRALLLAKIGPAKA